MASEKKLDQIFFPLCSSFSSYPISTRYFKQILELNQIRKITKRGPKFPKFARPVQFLLYSGYQDQQRMENGELI